jgi:hypothetical protein
MLVGHFLVEHDLFGKPASTFPDHAPAASNRKTPRLAPGRFSFQN